MICRIRNVLRFEIKLAFCNMINNANIYSQFIVFAMQAKASVNIFISIKNIFIAIFVVINRKTFCQTVFLNLKTKTTIIGTKTIINSTIFPAFSPKRLLLAQMRSLLPKLLVINAVKKDTSYPTVLILSSKKTKGRQRHFQTSNFF